MRRLRAFLRYFGARIGLGRLAGCNPSCMGAVRVECECRCAGRWHGALIGGSL